MKKFLLLCVLASVLQLVNGQNHPAVMDLKNMQKAELFKFSKVNENPSSVVLAKDYDNSIYKLAYSTSATEAYVLNPSFAAVPVTEIQNEGDVTFLSGAFMKNVGNLTLTGAKVTTVINQYPLSGGSATKVYEKTSTERVDIEKDSIRGLTVDAFDFKKDGKGLGRYQFTFTASQDSVDQTKGDNSFTGNMYITNNILSKCKLAPATKALQVTQYWGGGTAYREVLMPFSLKHGKGLTVDSLYAAIASNEGVADMYVEARLYKWEDANTDGNVDSDEMSPVAIGSYTVPSSTAGNFISLRIGLDNIISADPVYKMEDDGSLYFASLMYPGGSKSLFNGYEMVPSQRMLVNLKDAAMNLQYEEYPYLSVRTQTGAGLPDMTTASLFYVDLNMDGSAQDEEVFFFPVSMALQFSGVVATKDLSKSNIELSVSPNPAKDKAKVDIRLNKISDLKLELFTSKGDLVQTENISNRSLEITHSFDIQSMSPGTYYVKVTTANGSAKKPFIVIK